jgi:uracil-DNA glycosylase
MADNAERLQAIADQVAICTRCRLYEKARNPVPGAGNPNAEIMIIGEAPGEQEDLKGLPFIGRSGKYLDYLLGLIGLNRDQVFIANVVKHRPPGNRDPLPDEIAACKPYLDEQMEIIDPLLIVTLGRFSMARYFPNGKISQIHGQPKYDERMAYYPLFHPAAALRNPDLRQTMEEDINRIPSVLAEVRKRRAGASGDQPDAPTGSSEDDDKTPPQQLSLF